MLNDDVEIVYTVGSEHSPSDPFGQQTLSIRGAAVDLGVRRGGTTTVEVHGRLREGVMVELARALSLAAGEGNGSGKLVAGAAVAVITARFGARSMRLARAHDEARRLPGWSAALNVLDGVAQGLAPGKVVAPSRVVEGLVEGVSAAPAPRRAPVSPPSPGVPVTWAELRRQQGAQALRGVEGLASEAAEMQSVLDRLPSVALQLDRPADQLVRGALLGGLAGVGAGRRAFDRFVPRALDEVQRGLADARAAEAASSLLAYLHVQAFLGPPSPPCEGMERVLMPAIAPHARSFGTMARRRFALACVAAGQPSLIAQITDPEALQTPFVPHARFGPSAIGFAAHVARAQLARASADQVRPAFEELFAHCPGLLAAESIDWIGVSYAVRAFHAGIEGMPVSGLAAYVIRSLSS